MRRACSGAVMRAWFVIFSFGVLQPLPSGISNNEVSEASRKPGAFPGRLSVQICATIGGGCPTLWQSGRSFSGVLSRCLLSLLSSCVNGNRDFRG